MDCWHPITVRAEKPDAVQRWAQLEGKSPHDARRTRSALCGATSRRDNDDSRMQPFYGELIARRCSKRGGTSTAS